MSDALNDALRSVGVFVPRLVAFLVILLVGWLIAKAIAKAVNVVLERVGFDRAVERGGIRRALAQSKYDASDILAKLVYYALLLFVLQMAFGVFGPNPVSILLAGIIAFLPRIIVAIIIVVVAAAIASAVRDLIGNALSGLSYGKVLANIAAVFILGLGIIAALYQVGIATTVTLPVLVAVLATISGILIVGVGGGLIKPMQSRWENYLQTASRESQNFRQRSRTSSAQDQTYATTQPGGGGYDDGSRTAYGQGATGTSYGQGGGSTAYGQGTPYGQGTTGAPTSDETQVYPPQPGTEPPRQY